MESLADDIKSLSHGRPTRRKIGSVLDGHRLNQEERRLLSRAERVGYLEVSSKNRVNVINVYEKLCYLQGKPVILATHRERFSDIKVWVPQIFAPPVSIDLRGLFRELGDTFSARFVEGELVDLAATHLSRQGAKAQLRYLVSILDR